MASGEGFLTEEQREMLKIATQNVEILSPSPNSPSPKSPSPKEHHVKGLGGGRTSAAGGIPVRHVRRSHSGKYIRVKKGEQHAFGRKGRHRSNHHGYHQPPSSIRCVM